MIKQFFKDESGATMVEYAIMVALIAIAVTVAVIAIQSALSAAFNSVANCIKSGGNTGCSLPTAG